MSWRPLVEILPVVDAGAERAALVATGSSLPGGAARAYAASTEGQSGQVSPSGFGAASSGDAAGPQQLFRAGASLEEEAEANQQAQAEAAARENDRQAAYDEGAAVARAEGETLALRYRAAIEELATTREQLIRASEADLVRLALTIAREVLMADVPGREQFTQKMAEHALGLLQASPAVTLRLSGKDAAALRAHKPELLRRDDLTVVEDDTLEAGGVVAEAESGRIDASLTARLRAMADKLLPEGERAS